MPSLVYRMACFDRRGRMKWRRVVRNLVVDEGREYILRTFFGDDPPSDTWFLGLSDDSGITAPALNDTLARVGSGQATFGEFKGYQGNNRPAVSWLVSQEAALLSAPAVFTITDAGPVEIHGAFLCDVQSKDGYGGVLYSAAGLTVSAAPEPQTVVADDQLPVVVTLEL